MRLPSLCIVGILCCTAFASGAPPDVAPSRAWAAPAVRQLIANGVLGESALRRTWSKAPISHAAAAVALARLAKIVEERRWKPAPSVPVPERMPKAVQNRWRGQIVTGDVFAAALAKVGGYVANGVPEPHAAHPADLGKSITIQVGKVTAKPGTPVYASLQYLALRRTMSPDSPLLKGDSKPITAGELSLALAQWIDGLNDRMTELGHDKYGNTPDAPSIERERRERNDR
jgi:hypothetical protein